MPDIIGALTNKKSALLAQRRKIRETADKKIEDINLEIAKVDEAGSSRESIVPNATAPEVCAIATPPGAWRTSIVLPATARAWR